MTRESSRSQNPNPTLRFHWACALPVLAIFGLLGRGATVLEIIGTAVFLLIGLGAALLTWFIGRRRAYAGSLAFFCVMTVAALWITEQRGVNKTFAQATALVDTLDQRFNAFLGLKHKNAHPASTHTDAGSTER